MSSGGKSGSATKTLNYYGTVAGALAWRFDWLTALVSNGNYIWQCSGAGPLDMTAPGVVTADGYVDLTGGLLDPSLIMEGGYLRFYPGVATATPDPALPNNPAFRDCAGIVSKHIFFGQNSGTAPNIQAIGGHKPDVPTGIVAASDNVVDDRQVNPIASLAEFLLDERGGSMLEAQLHAASWLAASHWCAQDQAHRDYTFCSPLITDQGALRDVVRRLLDPIGGFLRWTSDGKLACHVYEWGVDPGGLTTFDARHWTRPPKISDADWDAFPTEIVVGCTDRAYEFQENTVRVPNQRAAQIRGTDDPARIDRKDVTRSWQASAHGAEHIRRLGAGKATVYVPRTLVATVLPGDKIKIDDDPEPGGAGAAQLARVDKVQAGRTDEVTLEVTLDPLVPATTYTPTWVSPLPDELFAGAVQSAPSLAHMLAIPLPLDYFGWPPSVGFLATRPSTAVNGFHAYFTDDPLNPFAELGVQMGFAARCQLVDPVTDTDGVLRLQLLDGADGPDAYIAADTPGGNVAEAQDDAMLAILVELDGSGRVALDDDGQAIIEFVSILERTAISADTHDYTVYRHRTATTARAWAEATAVWIIPNAALVAWRHTQFETMFAAPAYFRLASFTSSAADESSPLPETDMVWQEYPYPPAPAEVAIDGTGQHIDAKLTGGAGKYRVECAEVTWTLPTQISIVAVEWRRHTGANYFTGGIAFNGVLQEGKLPATQNWLVMFREGYAAEGYVSIWYRDSRGNAGPRTTISASGAFAQYIGSIAEDDRDDVNVSGLKVGSTSASSVRKVLALYTFNEVPTLTGGSAEEAVNISLSNRGFSTKPDGVAGAINVSSDAGMKARYDWDDAGNSATNAVVKISMIDGSTLGTGAVRIQGTFFEEF